MTKQDNEKDDTQKKSRHDDEIMDEKEAEASAPDDESIAGEEDPGAAIEEWVKMNKEYEKRHPNAKKEKKDESD
ncbi:hypothetical protein [Salinimonas chungwhensis]|uniref:hypothetical protein n=1 Tax=Salinimonas chungwhensis TaxID=265425 RepID=UPI00036B2206|nr:hypothetical protein [Salinimonas chungwhensis]